MSDDESAEVYDDDDNNDDTNDNNDDVIADVHNDIDTTELIDDADDDQQSVGTDQNTDIRVNPKAIFDDLAETEDEEVDEPDDHIVSSVIESAETENRLHKTIIVVDPSQRRTSNVMTEYELTEALVIRASQIEQRRSVLTNVDGLDDAEAMAEKELADGKCPLVLRRKVGEVVIDGKLIEYVEYYDVNKMTKPL